MLVTELENLPKRLWDPRFGYTIWGSPNWFGDSCRANSQTDLGTPIFGLGRDATHFQIGESHKRYGSFSNSVTNIYVGPRIGKSTLALMGSPIYK